MILTAAQAHILLEAVKTGKPIAYTPGPGGQHTKNVYRLSAMRMVRGRVGTLKKVPTRRGLDHLLAWCEHRQFLFRGESQHGNIEAVQAAIAAHIANGPAPVDITAGFVSHPFRVEFDIDWNDLASHLADHAAREGRKSDIFTIMAKIAPIAAKEGCEIDILDGTIMAKITPIAVKPT